MEIKTIINNTDDVLIVIQQAISELKDNIIDTKQANAIGFLLNTAIKCIEVRDLKNRLDEIEQKVDFSQKMGYNKGHN